MYYLARPPAKPWRISRNYACFIPDKMTSENWRGLWGGRPGKDKVMRREQRKPQRRLNKYLCRLDTGEWD